MSKTVKRFKKYNEEPEGLQKSTYDHRQHLTEKRLRAALRSKVKSSLLDLIENEYY
jgi:hypothetical protein